MGMTCEPLASYISVDDPVLAAGETLWGTLVIKSSERVFSVGVFADAVTGRDCPGQEYVTRSSRGVEGRFDGGVGRRR